MSADLPHVIEAYFEASNAADPERLADLFAATGEVRDEAKIYKGREAIAAWARDSQARYAMQTDPLAVVREDDVQVVTARVTGTFPGSPLDLTHRFTVMEDGIRLLEIGA